jgi:K+-sensing histidine kinase KdpD
MVSALTIVILLFASVYLGYLYFCSKKDLQIANSNEKIHAYQLDVLNELLSATKTGLNIEGLLDILISSINSVTNLDVAAYVIRDRNTFNFKCHVASPVGSSYVKELEKLCLESLANKLSLDANWKDRKLNEYISGHVLNSSNVFFNSYFLVPVKYRGEITAVMAISSVKQKEFVSGEKKLVKQIIKSSVFFLEKTQALTGVGLISDQYVNMVLHDLRTPLTVINGTSSILLKRGSKLKPTQIRGLYKDIKHSAAKLNSILNNLLDVARIQSGRVKITKRETEIVKFFKENVEDFRSLIEDRGIKYVVKAPKTQIKAHIDTGVTARILDNLISNANKYTEKGSIKVLLSKHKNKLKFTVKDTGIGMTAEEKEQLFNKFVQVAKPVDAGQKSTGLGLVIVKQLVHEQGGKIGVNSTKNKGSEFYFTLPIK